MITLFGILNNKTGAALVVFSIHNEDPQQLSNGDWTTAIFPSWNDGHERGYHVPALPALSELVGSHLHRTSCSDLLRILLLVISYNLVTIKSMCAPLLTMLVIMILCYVFQNEYMWNFINHSHFIICHNHITFQLEEPHTSTTAPIIQWTDPCGLHSQTHCLEIGQFIFCLNCWLLSLIKFYNLSTASLFTYLRLLTTHFD